MKLFRFRFKEEYVEVYAKNRREAYTKIQEELGYTFDECLDAEK